jgi:hypothetical protein
MTFFRCMNLVQVFVFYVSVWTFGAWWIHLDLTISFHKLAFLYHFRLFPWLPCRSGCPFVVHSTIVDCPVLWQGLWCASGSGWDPPSFPGRQRRTTICEGWTVALSWNTVMEYCSKSLFVMCRLYYLLDIVAINLSHLFLIKQLRKRKDRYTVLLCLSEERQSIPAHQVEHVVLVLCSSEQNAGL